MLFPNLCKVNGNVHKLVIPLLHLLTQKAYAFRVIVLIAMSDWQNELPPKYAFDTPACV